MRKLLALVVASAALVTAAASAFAVSGTVINTKGKPIARAKVCVYADDQNVPEKSRYKTIFADAKGRFNYQPKKGIPHYYFADVKGYAHAMTYRGRNDFNKKVQVKVWPEKLIRGRIIDLNGKPVAGASLRVRVFSFWDSPADEAKQQKPWFWFGERSSKYGISTSAKDGRFVIRHVADPSPFNNMYMRLEVTAPGHTMIDMPLDKRKAGQYLQITQPIAASFGGTVYLPGKSGTAPAGVPIAVSFGSAEKGYKRFSTVTDNNGHFSFTELPAAKVNVTLGLQAQRTGSGSSNAVLPVAQWTMPVVENVKLTVAKQVKLSLELIKGSVVSGKVIDKESGNTASEGYVYVKHSGQPDGQSDIAAIDKNGNFALRVPPGKVSVSLEYAKIAGNYVYDRSTNPVDFEAANGIDKTDVVLEVIADADSNDDYRVTSKPVPANFRLIPGTYQLVWDSGITYSDGSYLGNYAYNSNAKALITKLPKLISERPLYMAIPFDGKEPDGSLLVVFDESLGSGKGYDTAYIDANRNKDLSDDEPIKWRVSSNYFVTPWTLVQSHQGEGADQTNNPIKISMQISGGMPATLMKKGGWKGTIESSAGTIGALVVDTNGNGLYNDTYKCNPGAEGNRYLNYSQGDGVFADTNGFGRAVAIRYPDNPHKLMHGAVSMFGDKGYIVRANAMGNTLTVEPYTGKTGTLLLKGKVLGYEGVARSMSLTGDGGEYYRRNLSNPVVILPVGKYMLNYCSLDFKAGSKTTTLSGSVLKTVAIEPGKSTVFTVTGKPKLRALPNQDELIISSGKELTVNWAINIGDTFQDVSLSSAREASPKVAFDKSAMMTCKAAGGG